MANNIKLVVCGETASAHAVAGIAASRGNFDVKILVLDEEKAESWNNAMEESQFIVAVKKDEGEACEFRSTLELADSRPRACVKNADVIVFALPSGEHGKYLEAMEPYLPTGVTLIGLPSGPGFEFQCWGILKEKFFSCNVVSCEIAPWDSVIIEYGRKVKIVRTRKLVLGSIISNCRPKKPPFSTLQMIFGAQPMFKLSNCFLEMSLMSDFMHTFNPVFCHAVWRYLYKPIPQQPLLYRDISKDGACMTFSVSGELLALALALTQLKKSFNPQNISNLHNWLKDHFDDPDEIEDDTSTFGCLTTNSSLKDIVQPMKETDGKFVPDFECFYVREDLANGLCVIRGIAELANVPLPSVDDVILWCQKNTGREYLVKGKLVGKDVYRTRAPQRYGITSFEEMFMPKGFLPPVVAEDVVNCVNSVDVDGASVNSVDT